MVDYHKELVAALSKVLPTHYEMTLHRGLTTPCISYMETNQYSITPPMIHGTIADFLVQYQIKVWANDIALIQKYAKEVDAVLRPLGWKLVASGELYDNNSSMIQKIMTYEATARETY